MAWSFRRSLRLGPLRLNLSKSGLGASVGVKGARVGVDAKGKGYVSGGRGGFYFRERIATSTEGGQAPEPRSSGLWWIVAVAVVAVLMAVAILRSL